jgi:hypothetical protein
LPEADTIAALEEIKQEIIKEGYFPPTPIELWLAREVLKGR